MGKGMYRTYVTKSPRNVRRTSQNAVHGDSYPLQPIYLPKYTQRIKMKTGILARNIPSDSKDLEVQNISPISIVVCNTYQFTKTIAKPNFTLADAVEEVDIGGMTLLRAAAKTTSAFLSSPIQRATRPSSVRGRMGGET
jgi:hypothetical protein